MATTTTQNASNGQANIGRVELREISLSRNDALIAAFDELRGLVLGCWCAPRACHDDLLLWLANATLAQRKRWLALAA